MKRAQLFGGGAAVAALALLAVAPGTARATGLDFSSSMTASCVGMDCQTVQFALDPGGEAYARLARIPGNDAAVWQFGSVIGVTDKEGAPLEETEYAATSGSALQSADSDGGGAGRLYVAMGVTAAAGAGAWALQTKLAGGGPASLSGPILQGQGNGVGTVTPEPVSMVLLGTGLAGIAGVGRRRRRRAGSDAE